MLVYYNTLFPAVFCDNYKVMNAVKLTINKMRQMSDIFI